ncbi:MAG: universal stress protein [Planctomycetaceae bacterium]
MSFKPKEKVVVPIDFSESSAAAVREGLRCAASASGVHVVHVAYGLQPVAPYGYFHFEEPDAQKYLDDFISKNHLQGVTPVVLCGDAGTEITRYAEEQNADLIVIPSHGYHGMNRWLLGSTAERVIRHAHCPVYVLRRRDAE